MADTIDDLVDAKWVHKRGEMLGIKWFDYQITCFHMAEKLYSLHQGGGPEPRLCLYYRTGAGKSITALMSLALMGANGAVVIAPPSTHESWEEQARGVGIHVTTMSHAKFRMKSTKLGRHTAVIADEFHMFGGHRGQGWLKLDRLAKGLQAPMILASATPNYNDAERVYCIQHILDPIGTKGGFLDFLYRECHTEQNPFGMVPNVTGFRRFADAEEYLANMAKVVYVPDELVFTINDVPVPKAEPDDLVNFGYNERKHRMVASIIEMKHTVIDLSLLDERGFLWMSLVGSLISQITASKTPVLVFANHSTVAEGAYRALLDRGVRAALVTGKTGPVEKQRMLNQFKAGEHWVLVGTASLATGTDGLDKVSDRLIIIDDTDDDSLRRQLIGRIMPRGADSDASNKSVIRWVLS